MTTERDRQRAAYDLAASRTSGMAPSEREITDARAELAQAESDRAHYDKGYDHGFCDGVNDGAPDLLGAAKAAAAHFEGVDSPLAERLRAAIKFAEAGQPPTLDAARVEALEQWLDSLPLPDGFADWFKEIWGHEPGVVLMMGGEVALDALACFARRSAEEKEPR